MLHACVRKFDLMDNAQTFLETPPNHFANGIMVLQCHCQRCRSYIFHIVHAVNQTAQPRAGEMLE